MKKYRRGFTLIEILVVIGIIAILAAIVVVAINPAKQFAQARNTDRQSAVDNILNAVGQRMADNKGVFGGVIGTTGQVCPQLSASTPDMMIYSTTTASTTQAYMDATVGDYNYVSLSCLTPIYLAKFPADPVTASSTNLVSGTPGFATGYTLNVNSSGRITVCAPASIQEPSLSNIVTDMICVTR